MLFRFLLLLLGVTVFSMAGQTGLFGPVSTHVKAGDLAPDIVFTGTLNAGGLFPWSQVNLAGQLTVLTFFPDTSHNLQSVTRWNALVELFADKPVQFVWITGEEESSLLPWLKQHPVKGWVFYDPDGATGRAYGMEMPSCVIIGNDRKIIGFDGRPVPTEGTLNAALEGRITTVPLKPGSAAIKAFVESRMVRLDAEPRRMPRAEEYRPDFPPSYTLHVSPAKSESGGNFGGDDFWSLQNVDLKSLISLLYDINPVRIDFPASLDDGKRYDFAMVLPEPESREQMKDRFRQGAEDYFHFTAVREERFMDAYVVTAPNGKPPAAKSGPDDIRGFSGFSSASVGFDSPGLPDGLDEFNRGPKAVGIANIRGISVEGTIDEFCKTLERSLDRPVVNETNLEGQYIFRVEASKGNGNDFLERLRDQSHLSITPAQRRVQIVVLRAR